MVGCDCDEVFEIGEELLLAFCRLGELLFSGDGLVTDAALAWSGFWAALDGGERVRLLLGVRRLSGGFGGGSPLESIPETVKSG